MKKRRLISFSFLLALSFMLVGCGKNKKTTKVTTNQTTTSSHVHEFGDWKTLISPTCTEEGYRKRVCACGEEEYDVIEQKPHTYVEDKCTFCHHERLTEGFNIYYSNIDDYYHINDYTGSNSTVRIPYLYDDGTHGEKKITIDRTTENYEFISSIKDCNIKKIIVGEGYTSIPNYMFLGLNNLEEVIIESDIKQIGDQAFYNCPKLSKISFGESIETIGFHAFGKCNFKEIRLPYNLKYLDVGVFSDNEELESVTYYNNLLEIGDNCFNNTAITRVKIPYSLTYFGYQEKMDKLTTFVVDGRSTAFAFEDDCLVDLVNKSVVKALNNAVIPSDVDTLEPFSFAYLDYSEVDEFIVPTNIKNIGFSTFVGTTFKSFTFSSGLKTIGEAAFSETTIDGAEDLVITLPSSLTSIASRAFSNFSCKEIIIPESVTEVGYNVFMDCTIGKITIHRSTIDSEDCDSYWDYGIDEEITTINIIND